MTDKIIHYETPARLIGKHEWRCIVVDASFPIPGRNTRCTVYQWRRAGGPETWWRDDRQWPSYDINDGCYLGMPKSLATLYRDYKEAILAAIENRDIHRPAIDYTDAGAQHVLPGAERHQHPTKRQGDLF